jgi:hypothetical protein
MNIADFNELSEVEKRHFHKCQQCGEMVDIRQLDDVLFHEDHKPGPIFNTAAPAPNYSGPGVLLTFTKYARAKIIAVSI